MFTIYCCIAIQTWLLLKLQEGKLIALGFHAEKEVCQHSHSSDPVLVHTIHCNILSYAIYIVREVIMKSQPCSQPFLPSFWQDKWQKLASNKLGLNFCSLQWSHPQIEILTPTITCMCVWKVSWFSSLRHAAAPRGAPGSSPWPVEHNSAKSTPLDVP